MASQCFTKQFLRAITSQLHGQMVIQKRSGSYMGSKLVGSPTQYTDVEVSNNPEEWKFVERLLPPKYIPTPTLKESYPSGWVPPKESAKDLPYFMKRSRHHLPSIYLEIDPRYQGNRRYTKLKGIQGDIWALEEDLKNFLEHHTTKPVITHVNELSCIVQVRGDFVSLTQKWFHEKGF